MSIAISNLIDLPKLVESCINSVVFIYVEATEENKRRLFGNNAQSLAEAVEKNHPKIAGLFNRPKGLFPFGLASRNKPKILKALGSGVVLNESGYILTNRHVAANAISLTVHNLVQGPVKAEIVDISDKYDLALIKASSEIWEPLPFESKDQLKVGSPVIAIGNPLGLESTVTLGIISALNRTLEGSTLEKLHTDPGVLEDKGIYIQTDTAINPGNSGGAMINMSGNLVGINTVKISDPTHGISDVNFAVQLDCILDFVKDQKIFNLGA
jgi:S1-C subfamily serine protease